MDRTVSEALRPQREIVGALGRFVAAVVSIRRNEGSLYVWHETVMRFESRMIGLRTSWRGALRAGLSDKTVWRAEFDIGTVESTHEDIPEKPVGWLRSEGTG